jgi:hypothetical protein
VFGFDEASTSGGQGWVVIDPRLEGAQCTDLWFFYLATTWWQEYGVAPVIQSISPNGLTLGGSGTLTILGLYLTADGLDLNPVVGSSGSGLSLGTPQVVNDGQLDVSYSVSSNPSSTGTYGITVTNSAGTSNTMNVTVGDPTPAISSVSQSPNPWIAGQSGTLTISGTGFGTNPQVTISGTGIAYSSTPCSGAQCDKQIQMSVSIAPTAPTQTAWVTVTSQGYNGSGFVSAGGSSSSGSNEAAAYVEAELPVPQIMFNDINIAGQTTGVYVGQQIPLTAVVNLPNGAAPTSQSWQRIVQSSGLAGTVVGGYVPQQAGSTLTTLPAGGNCQTLSSSCLTFYWVDQGTWQWQYTYTYANQSNSAVATFNVYGPVTSTPEVTTQTGSAQALVDLTRGAGLYLAGVQFQAGQVGILFQTAALPAPGNNGTYQWAQIVTNDQVKRLTSSGVQTCVSPDGYPGLDGNFPYGTPGASLFSVNRPNDTATDNPGVPFNAGWGELRRLFSAKMYLMWDPTLPSGCTAATPTSESNCKSIPVPLASIVWSYPGDAINTLQNQQNGTTWVTPCGPGQAGQCVTVAPGTDPRQSFPQWTQVLNISYNCQ